jgi:hypothetical protein
LIGASEECADVFVTDLLRANWWTPHLTNPKMRYAFVTKNGLTRWEDFFKYLMSVNG